MARKIKRVTRDYLLTLLQTRTQKQAAKELGIGERTIRRIKNEPNHKTTKRVSTVVAEVGQREITVLRRVSKSKMRSEVVKRETARYNDEQQAFEKALATLKRRKAPEQLIKDFTRDHKPRPPIKRVIGGKKLTIPDVPVLPPYKRESAVDYDDKKRATRKLLDTLVFDVRELSIENIVDLIASYRGLKQRYAFRVVFGVPVKHASSDGELYQEGKRKRAGRRFVLDGRGGTEWEPLKGARGGKFAWTREKLLNMLQSKTFKTKSGKHNFLYVYMQRL